MAPCLAGLGRAARASLAEEDTLLPRAASFPSGDWPAGCMAAGPQADWINLKVIAEVPEKSARGEELVPDSASGDDLVFVGAEGLDPE